LSEAKAEADAARESAATAARSEKKEESEQGQQLRRLKDSLEAAKEIILSKEGELAAIEQIRQERDVLAEMVRTLQDREATRPDPKQEIKGRFEASAGKVQGPVRQAKLAMMTRRGRCDARRLETYTAVTKNAFLILAQR
jgi:hypothetical protein